MKKIVILVMVLLVGSTFSCKKGFLDQIPDDRLTLDETFTSKATAERFLANIYNAIPDESQQRYINTKNSGPWTGASDEADYVWGFVESNNINNGTFDATSGFVQGYWNTFYQAIRSVNIFIANINRVTDLSDALKAQYIAEAKGLRAIYYSYLMRIYGPVILVGDKELAPDGTSGDFTLPRSTYDECVDYVSSEMDAAAAALPVTSNATNLGRLTKPIVLAYKSNMLLSAASPLFNGNADYSTMKNKDGKQLINQSVDIAKWKRAADATKDFLTQFVPGKYDLYRKDDENGAFSAYLSCRDVMLDSWNKEVIMSRNDDNIGMMQYERTPYHQGFSDEVRASGGLGATQEMVDAFFTANGRSISDPKSGYVPEGFNVFQPPYDNDKRALWSAWIDREPRFYVNITFNGARWINSNTFGDEVFTFLFNNGNSGRETGGNDYSTTGYIVRKNVGTGPWGEGGRSLVLIRLAEIYLNYAEALNESDPGNSDILKYINLIRERAGIPQYGKNDLEAPVGQVAMRLAIQKERRVELAFENTRYFDVRRWKIAEQTDNGPIHGLNITKNPMEFFEVRPVESRVFLKKNYLFPIPQNDINTDKQLVQNTGW